MNLTISGFARLLAPAGYVDDIPLPEPVDTTPPTVSLVSSSMAVTQKQNITLTATASDNVGVVKVEFYRGDLLVDTKTVAPYTAVVAFTEQDNGILQFKAKAFDANDNVSTSSVVEVAVDIVVIPESPTYPFTVETQLLAAYNAAIADAVSGVKRLAGANAIINAMKPDYRLYIYQGDNLVVPIEFSGDLKVVDDGVDVSISLGIPDNSDPIVAAQLSQGVWHFALEGGAQYTRFIKGSVGTVGSGKLMTLSSDPEPGTGTNFSFKLVVPRSIDIASTDAPTVPVDTTPPTISLTTSKTQTNVDATITLTAAVTDDVKVAKVEFMREDVVFETKTEAPWAATQSLTMADNGNVTYTARAVDTSGNTTTSSKVFVLAAIDSYVRIEDLKIDTVTSDSMTSYANAATSGTEFTGKRIAASRAIIDRFAPAHRLYLSCDDEIIYDVGFAGPMISVVRGTDVAVILNIVSEGIAKRDLDINEGNWTFKVTGNNGLRSMAGAAGPLGSGANLMLRGLPAPGTKFNTNVAFVMPRSLDGLT